MALFAALGFIVVFLAFVFGVVELASIRSIRPPKRRTFSHTRLAATQYQTVFAPAVGALISGLFVSVSASFLFISFTEDGESWHTPVGVGVFLAGAVSLALTLRSLLTDAGEPAEMARDPFTIRAAAEESAADPRRGVLGPEVLAQQLDDWEKYASMRAMNLPVNEVSELLDQSLEQSVQVNKFWKAVRVSLHVYYAALRKFPFRFGWPIGGAILFALGSVLVAVTNPDASFWSWMLWFKLLLVAVIGFTPTLFYCVTRGNRARLWHRINIEALREARGAIGAAESAFRLIAAEDARLQRVLSRADLLFEGGILLSEPPERTVFQLGRFRLARSTSPSASPA